MNRNVVILGANGALGTAVSKKFLAEKWGAILCDVTEPVRRADSFVQLHPGSGAKSQFDLLQKFMLTRFGSSPKLDAVINMSGGFRMDNVASDEIFENLQLMYSSSVESSFIASHLAAKYLKESGVLVLPGAAATAGGTPWATSYGSMKTSVHHLVKSVSLEGGGLPRGAKAVGIAPVMLDTPANRTSMPDANMRNWTPLDEVAEIIFSWANSTEQIVSGTVYKIETVDGHTGLSSM